MNEKIERPKHLDDWANPDHYFSEACLKASMYAIALEQQLAAETARADQHLATVGELRKVIDRLENDNRRLRDLPLIGQHVERCPSPPALTADDVTMIVHNILRQRDLNDSARRACAGPPLQADDVREIARDEAKQMMFEAYSGVEDDDFHGFMGALK